MIKQFVPKRRTSLDIFNSLKEKQSYRAHALPCMLYESRKLNYETWQNKYESKQDKI